MVFRIRQPIAKSLYHTQAGIEADEVYEFKLAHRIVGDELHRLVDNFNRADGFTFALKRVGQPHWLIDRR